MKQRKQKPSKRRTHSAEFKARIALEALKGIQTLNQLTPGSTKGTTSLARPSGSRVD